MSWTSAPLHLTPHTCVDVKADSKGVTLGEVGEVSLHNLHFTPDQARTAACMLIEGADKAEVWA